MSGLEEGKTRKTYRETECHTDTDRQRPGLVRLSHWADQEIKQTARRDFRIIVLWFHSATRRTSSICHSSRLCRHWRKCSRPILAINHFRYTSVRCAVALLLIQAARLSSKTLKILAVLCHARQCNAWCYVTLCYVTLRHAMLCRPNVIVGCHPNGRVGYGKRGDLRRSGRERDAEGRLMWAEGVGNEGIWRLDRASRREVEDGGILKWHFTVLERLRPFSLYCNKQLWGRAE